MPYSHRILALAAMLLSLLIPHAVAQVPIENDVRTLTSISNTTFMLAGRAELRITGSGDPIPGCVIHLNSPDAWFFLTEIAPSIVESSFLSRVRVDGASAVSGANVRVVQYGNGAVVIPHAPGFAPMTVYTGRALTGRSQSLRQYTKYGWRELGNFNDNIRSFTLKRGYTATIATEPNGTGTSRNYVAADGDLEVGGLPDDLDLDVSFVRVFPWRWVSKKGTCDVGPVALNAAWNYNWNISSRSTLDWEYVGIRQQRYWPGLDQDWGYRGINHLSGYNEPNNPVEDAYQTLGDGSRDVAVASWPDLLGTGLRVGTPAVTDGGVWWLQDFMNKMSAAGHRLDYAPVHYYRSYWNKNDPQGAANQLYNFLKTVHDVTGLPVWVTEFNNGANWTDNAHDPSPEQNRDAIQAMITRMDDTWWIERYSIYSRVEWFRQTHYDDGSITPMGAMYRDHESPIGYVQQVPDPNISSRAHYTFDGSLRDALGRGNEGMAVGAPNFVPGRIGQAIDLDGSNDYVQLPASLGDSNDFTFAGWIKWDGGGNWQRIFDLGAGGTDNYVFLTPKSGGNRLAFTIRDSGSDQSVDGPALPVGVWRHVAVTIADTTATLYVNGAAVGTNTSFTLDPGKLGTRFNYLGKSQYPDPLFNGQLDDLRFLSYPLSAAEIAALAGASSAPQFGAPLYTESAAPHQPFTAPMSGRATGGSGARTFRKIAGPAWLAVAADGTLTGVPASGDVGMNRILIGVTDAVGQTATTMVDVGVTPSPGLVARYAFDGNTDTSVGTAHAAASGSPGYSTGIGGIAINLDGTEDFLRLPAGIASLDEITIASWFRSDSSASWQRIFDFGTDTDQYMFLCPRSNASTIQFSIKNGGAAQFLEAPALPTGQWVHVAVTLGNNVGKLYVNGALADTGSITIKPTDFLHGNSFIGDSQWPNDPFYDGRIDEFQIYNHVLDAVAIAGLADSGARAPVFAASPISKPVASPNQSYVDSIAGSATDPNPGTEPTFSKVGGPRWLTVEPDGRISGVPTEADAGSNRFTVRATDPTGLASEATLVILVASPPDLRAHYQFDGNTSDSAGSYHGTTTGGPGYTDATFDRAVTLDGSDDFVTLPAGIVNGLADITLAARVRWDGGSSWQRVFDFGNGTGSYLFLTPKSPSDKVRFAIKNGGSEQPLEADALPVGEWTHVAVTLVGNTGTLYINGAQVDRRTITLNPSNVAPAANYLGKSQWPDPLFNGAIDDFRIYDYGLDAGEVSALASPVAPTVVPRSAYLAWAEGISFPAGKGGPDQDAEFDGVANVFEFLMGGAALAVDTGVLPPAVMRTATELGLPGDKTYLTLTARLRADREGVTVVAEGGATMGDLSAASAPQLGAPVPDGDFEFITWYYAMPMEDSPGGTGFLRLRAVVE